MEEVKVKVSEPIDFETARKIATVIAETRNNVSSYAWWDGTDGEHEPEEWGEYVEQANLLVIVNDDYLFYYK